MSFFKLFFIIFQDVISSLILIAAIFIGKLSELHKKIALMCMQWLS